MKNYESDRDKYGRYVRQYGGIFFQTQSDLRHTDLDAWTLAGILVIALVWMGLFRIDLVTHADGMIRSGSATATITNVTDGTILAWDAEDGEYVKAGQTIYSIDPSELKKQEKSCAAELKNTEQRLEILEAYYSLL